MVSMSVQVGLPTGAPAPVPVPPGAALAAQALSQLRQAVLQLAREGEDRHEGVHQARKSLRRARAALALGGKSLGSAGRVLDEQLGRFCRGLSPLRDAQALLEGLDRLAPDGAPAPDWLEDARRLARARRDAVLAAVLARDPGFGRRRARLGRMAERIAALPWARVDARRVERGLAKSERRLDKARRRALRSPADDEAWHRLRRRLRRLRQQATLLEAMPGAPVPTADVPLALATALGEAQDDALLLRHCGSRSPFPPPLRARLRRLGRERLHRARAALGQA